MTPRILSFVVVCSLGASAVAPAQPNGFRVETVATGLNLACAMAFAPDGRLFVVERRAGTIRVVEDGQLGPVWASIGNTTQWGKDGFLGIAIDPDFLDNGYVYVHFRQDIPVRHMVIGRFQEQNGTGQNLTILTPRMSGTGRHVGGPLVVGRDGKLYAAVGDGAVPQLAQALSQPHGKVLRYNLPDLSVPADNPFAGTGAFEWIWSYGHRNPFGLSVHPQTGDIYETENGDGTGDEFNRISRGGNFGWSIYNGPEPIPDPVTVDPLWTIPHPEPALTGHAFYSGSLYPAAYQNRWFVGAFNQGEVWELDVDAADGTVRSITEFHRFGATFGILNAPDGNLWVLENEVFGQGADRVVRFVHDDAPFPSVNVTPVSNVAVGGSLTFGMVGNAGDAGVWWLAPQRLNPPLQTPFGLLEVPLILELPSVTIGGDGRAFLGVPIPDNPSLRGGVIWVQGATVQGSTIRLTNADSYQLH